MGYKTMKMCDFTYSKTHVRGKRLESNRIVIKWEGLRSSYCLCVPFPVFPVCLQWMVVICNEA